ncbi:MAG: UvrD-helicase domain-containing protein, partial [Solirubrobacteraceae bacterium]
MSASAPIEAATGERAWTDEQRRAIDRREGDLLLDAGAGSGKTSVLVERFVRSVLQDGIEPTAILAITFTEKAAAELRDRIRARLAALGAHDAARATEGAFISTIHGFCARVLRAHALAAGLDPRFVVLDRDRGEPLSGAAFEEALDELAGGHPGTVDLLAAYGAGPLRAAIVAVHAQLRSAGSEHPSLPPLTPRADPDPSMLREAAVALAAELGAIAAPGPTVAAALRAVGACLELIEVEDLWPCALNAARLAGNGAALSTDACERYAELLAGFREDCAARAAGADRDLLDLLLDSYGRHYERRKRALSGVDFEDLELIVRRLLRDDAELRERYAARFERIMVDELQDTNPVQMELIESIASGNLFTVGDAQQSIYGFRHARVELFERRGERLDEHGARETLRTNFRSRPEILAAIDLAFADELGERHRRLVPGRGSHGVQARVELLLVDKAADWEEDVLASPWRLAEARGLADRLAQLVAAGQAPGDIVVLLRATTDMRTYERALESRGLPTYVIGGRGYWTHPQILDCVAYLRALANPRDEEALLGMLASPFAGLSVDALVILAAVARDAGRDPWWALREGLDALHPGDRTRAEAFVTWFASERERATRGSLESLIDRALARSGYDLEMLAMPGGRRRLANVRKLMRLAREHERVDGPDLRGFLEAIEERSAGRVAESRESEAPVEGEALDAIRLMTIHRAKGLEFPVVAVADLGRSVRPPSELLRVGPDGRLGIRLARAGAAGRESALDYTALGEEQRRAAEAEERRLLYVAVTRARERLILSGATRFDWLAGEATASGGGPVAWIAPGFVPNLGELAAGDGGEVVREGTRIAVRIGHPVTAPGAPAACSTTAA